jgi:hypothetical protein
MSRREAKDGGGENGSVRDNGVLLWGERNHGGAPDYAVGKTAECLGIGEWECLVPT